MDETPIRGEVRVLDFASEEPSEEFDYDAAFTPEDIENAVPQFPVDEEFADLISFPEQSGPPVTINREELIFLSASLGAGQLDVALTLSEAAAIFDALGSVLA